MTTENYANHIATITQIYSDALQSVAEQDAAPTAVLVHRGAAHHYYGDDRGIAFQGDGHLLHWIPVNRPTHFVYFQPGEKPIYYQIIPSDFWFEQDISIEPDWGEALAIVRLSSLNDLVGQLQQHSGSAIAYLGENADVAASLGIDKALVNPQRLLAYLDFSRAIKTAYELDQLRSANRLALLGHAAAKDCFLAGGSEYEIHMAYLQATQSLEDETPYTNIEIGRAHV